jgi:hypothetical protein
LGKRIGGATPDQKWHNAFIDVFFDDLCCSALLDTGASVSVVSRNVLNLLHISVPELHVHNLPLKAVNDSNIEHFGKIELTVRIASLTFTHLFFVVDMSSDVILGWDFLYIHSFFIAARKGTVNVSGETLETKSKHTPCFSRDSTSLDSSLCHVNTLDNSRSSASHSNSPQVPLISPIAPMPGDVHDEDPTVKPEDEIKENSHPLSTAEVNDHDCDFPS